VIPKYDTDANSLIKSTSPVVIVPLLFAESKKYINDRRTAIRNPNISHVKLGTYFNFSTPIRIKHSDIKTIISARPVFKPANLEDCQGSRIAKQINKNSSRPNLVAEDKETPVSFRII
jgi:hypothetical protein